MAGKATVLMMVLGVWVGCAFADPLVIPTSYGNGADAQVYASDTNYGSATSVALKAFTGGSYAKGYFRFDLSSLAANQAASDATLQLYLNSTSQVADYVCYVYGLNDGDAGEGWSEGTITWNNAPANGTTNTVIASRTTYLGTFTVASGTSNNSLITFQSAALTNFINGDTDHRATFIITRELGLNNVIWFWAKENGSMIPALSLNLVTGTHPATPTFAPDGGSYVSAQNVVMTTDIPDATIWYTSNGDVPSVGHGQSIANGASVSVTQTMTLKAVAVKGDFYSGVKSASFSLLSNSLSVPTNYGNGADAMVAKDITTPWGGLEYIAITSSNYGTYAKSYLRFDLSSLAATLAASDASLNLYLYTTAQTADYHCYVYGLNDGDAGENWPEGTIIWDNAPANGATSTVDAARTTYLGDFTIGSTPANGMVSFQSAALKNFINGDTNHIVTLIITREMGDNSLTFFWTKEKLSMIPALSLGLVTGTHPAAPTFAPDGGSYVSAQNVVMTTDIPDATIWYTTNGDVPSVGHGQSIANGASVSVTQTMTLKAVAVKGDFYSGVKSANYTIIPSPMSVPTSYGNGADALVYQGITDAWGITQPYVGVKAFTGGSYAKSYLRFDLSSLTTILAASDASLTLYMQFTGQTADYHYYVYGLNDGDAEEGWSEGTIIWDNAPANGATNTVDPARTTYLGSFTIGSTPDNGTVNFQSAALKNFINGDTNHIVTLIITREMGDNSATIFWAKENGSMIPALSLNLVTGTHPATPAFAPDGGSYVSAQNVVMTTDIPDATIWYTTNGDVPSVGHGQSMANGASVLVNGSMTLKAVAVKGDFYSGVKIADYAMPTVAVPSFSPDGGSYADTQNVVITGDGGSTIYWTTNGDTPTVSSPNSGASPVTVAVSQTLTLKSIAVQGGLSSAIKSADYILARPRPIPYGHVAVDGDLSDWTGVTWAPLDQPYYGTATDVYDAAYAVKWMDEKVYVAVKVRDTNHVLLGPAPAPFAFVDGVEIYLHTTGAGPLDYMSTQADAQQYFLNIRSDNTSAIRACMGGYAVAVPSWANFEAAGRADGDWLYYEVAVTPFQHFNTASNDGVVISPLSANAVIGVDVLARSKDGATAPEADVTENLLTGKNLNYNKIAVHKLAAPTAADLSMILAAMDTKVSDLNYKSQADLDGDGEVTSTDLSMLLAKMQ